MDTFKVLEKDLDLLGEGADSMYVGMNVDQMSLTVIVRYLQKGTMFLRYLSDHCELSVQGVNLKFKTCFSM